MRPPQMTNLRDCTIPRRSCQLHRREMWRGRWDSNPRTRLGAGRFQDDSVTTTPARPRKSTGASACVETPVYVRRIGRRDRNRTCNLRIWRPLLCQLSYPPSHRAMIPYPSRLCNFAKGAGFRCRVSGAGFQAERISKPCACPNRKTSMNPCFSQSPVRVRRSSAQALRPAARGGSQS